MRKLLGFGAFLGLLALCATAHAAGFVGIQDPTNPGYVAAVDSTGHLSVTGTSTVSGNVTVVQPTASNLNATVVGTGTFAAQITPATSGGTSTYSGNVTTAGSGAGVGGVAVDASPGQLYGYQIWNGNSSVCYIQFFDQTQALTNLGTTTPKKSIGIPALGGANLTFPIGVPFATAITIGATTTRAGSTACSTGLDINLDFK